MITLDPKTLQELILRSEPDFIAQTELQFNGFGRVSKVTDEDFVWIWNKERVRTSTDNELVELVVKIID